MRVIFVGLAVALGLIPAVVAAYKGRSALGWWVYGSALFPVAILHVLSIKTQPREQASRKGARLCPHCGELIRREATVCKHCRARVRLHPSGPREPRPVHQQPLHQQSVYQQPLYQQPVRQQPPRQQPPRQQSLRQQSRFPQSRYDYAPDQRSRRRRPAVLAGIVLTALVVFGVVALVAMRGTSIAMHGPILSRIDTVGARPEQTSRIPVTPSISTIPFRDSDSDDAADQALPPATPSGSTPMRKTQTAHVPMQNY
jgi:hypothetical protein